LLFNFINHSPLAHQLNILLFIILAHNLISASGNKIDSVEVSEGVLLENGKGKFQPIDVVFKTPEQILSLFRIDVFKILHVKVSPQNVFEERLGEIDLDFKTLQKTFRNESTGHAEVNKVVWDEVGERRGLQTHFIR
jgi:hypothetical protein